MPQEFHVLLCYECKTYQVHPSKKAKKWSCKMCGEKQSYLKVFGVGTGAECRQHVQKLNMFHGQMAENLGSAKELPQDNSTSDEKDRLGDDKTNDDNTATTAVRWDKYMTPMEREDQPEDGVDEEQDDGCTYYLASDLPRNNRKRRNHFNPIESKASSRTNMEHHVSPQFLTTSKKMKSTSPSSTLPTYTSSICNPDEFNTINSIVSYHRVDYCESERKDRCNSSWTNKFLINKEEIQSEERLPETFNCLSKFSTQDGKLVRPSFDNNSKSLTQMNRVKTDASDTFKSNRNSKTVPSIKSLKSGGASKWSKFISTEMENSQEDDEDDESQELNALLNERKLSSTEAGGLFSINANDDDFSNLIDI